MKRYIKNAAMISPLKKEADRVYNKLNAYPDVLDMIYVDDTDSYCIRFNNDADDISWIHSAMEELGFTPDGNDEDATYWHNDNCRAWLYEDPDLELYISK